MDIIFIALFVALISVSAQIAIPTIVPFTLQTLGVFVSSALLGCKRGTTSILIYIFLGSIGLPIFSGFSGGVGKLTGPTGGYIVGFILTAVVVGLMCDLLGKKLWVLITSMTAGLLLCYLLGTIWFCISSKTNFISASMLCVVPFIIPDVAKIIVASILVKRLDKIVEL
ncbi:MAG: biotin transporter BioY [Acutalibacteraceae bacterium]|nr:biotin transporter BioY [Acutalibacteraceae bacterium]